MDIRNREQERQRELHAMREEIQKGVQTMWPIVFSEPVDYSMLVDLPILTNDFSDRLVELPGLGKFARHDLAPVTGGAIGLSRMMVESGEVVPTTVEDDQMARTILREYVLILTDISLRLDDMLGVTTEYSFDPVEESAMVELFENLKKSVNNQNNADITVHDFHEGTFEEWAPGTVSSTRAAMMYIGARNVLSNAVKTEIEATEVSLTYEVTHTGMQLTITDNGVGMIDGRLDPTSDNFIFREGVSGRGSSGLGLAELDERYKEQGMELAVASSGQQYSNSGVSLAAPEKGSTFHIAVPFNAL
jgi:signal transduction histidine kinase